MKVASTRRKAHARSRWNGLPENGVGRHLASVGFDDGVKQALERAQKTLRHVRWFEVKEQRGRITAQGIEYQVTIEVGFALEDTL